MRTLIKLFSLSFLVCSVLYVFSSVAVSATSEDGRALTFVVIGFDESPANTDVLSVVSYDSGANTVRAVQIPRDTYINFGDKNGKINGFYSDRVLKGETSEEALSSLADKISRLLGIEIDGYLSLTQAGLVDFVDFIGGVDVNATEIPEELASLGKVENGKMHLDGKSAVSFVRYRKNYLRGDLERLDAQKVFTRALFKAVKERRELFSLFKFISDSEEISFDVNKGRSFSFVLENIFKASDADFQMATLPGEAQKSGGVWYYVVKREEADAMIDGYFPYRTKNFDEQNDFIYKL